MPGKSNQTKTDKLIILFDGVCNLCNGSVQFLIHRDRRKTFKFASLQSDAGWHLLRQNGLLNQKIDSIVLITGSAVHIKSDAVLHIAALLPFPWPLFKIFHFVPFSFRDFIYDFIARNRYRWFGKKESCLLPAAEFRNCFLE